MGWRGGGSAFCLSLPPQAKASGVFRARRTKTVPAMPSWDICPVQSPKPCGRCQHLARGRAASLTPADISHHYQSCFTWQGKEAAEQKVSLQVAGRGPSALPPSSRWDLCRYFLAVSLGLSQKQPWDKPCTVQRNPDSFLSFVGGWGLGPLNRAIWGHPQGYLGTPSAEPTCNKMSGKRWGLRLSYRSPHRYHGHRSRAAQMGGFMSLTRLSPTKICPPPEG